MHRCRLKTYRMSSFLTGIAFVLAQFFLSTISMPSHAQEPSFARVFIQVEQFETYQAQGAAILDVRSQQAYQRGHIPGSVHAPWTLFVEGDNTGLVSENDEKLQKLLRSAGVRNDKPVLIYGNWSHRNAWGEEGRLLWMLHYLGHNKVYILQGGFKSWLNHGKDIKRGISTPESGDFRVARKPAVRATTAEVLQKLQSSSEAIFLDTRERVEYRGQVKYGETRAGHIPGAKHFWWYNLFDANGQLRSPKQLREIFASLELSDDAVLIPYCTGGIRSGFVYAVLVAMGYENVKNYDGSMWEYTALEDAPLTLPQAKGAGM